MTITTPEPTIDLNRLVGFDLETTGIDVCRDRLVTASLVEVDPETNRLVAHREWLVNPGVPIPPRASEVHGIYDDDVKDAQAHQEAVREVWEALEGYWERGYTIVAYNASYDLSMLVHWVLTYGITVNRLGNVLDPLVIDRDADARRRGVRNLLAVSKHYGVNLTEADAHASAADAAAAVKIARAIFDQIGQTSGWLRLLNDPGAFMEEQRQASLRHTRKIANYRKVPVESMDYGWPLYQRVIDLHAAE